MGSALTRRRVLALLLGISLCFFAATLAERATGLDAGLIEALDTTNEGGPAAWYSSLLLLASAVLCARGWLPLGIALALMAVDEVVQVHESAPGLVMDALETVLGLSGSPARLLAAAATVAAALVALLALRPWYRSLPVPTRRLVGVSAALFLTGAIGLELAARLLDPAQDGADLWLGPVEELFEMVGAALFVFALWPTAAAVSFVDSRVNETGAPLSTWP
jgi:hypothetical protein